MPQQPADRLHVRVELDEGIDDIGDVVYSTNKPIPDASGLMVFFDPSDGYGFIRCDPSDEPTEQTFKLVRKLHNIQGVDPELTAVMATSIRLTMEASRDVRNFDREVVEVIAEQFGIDPKDMDFTDETGRTTVSGDHAGMYSKPVMLEALRSALERIKQDEQATDSNSMQ